MSIQPGAIALKGRSKYYASEARRVQDLADANGAGEGRDRFLEVALEYRTLAAWYATGPLPDEAQALKLAPPS